MSTKPSALLRGRSALCARPPDYGARLAADPQLRRREQGIYATWLGEEIFRANQRPSIRVVVPTRRSFGAVAPAVALSLPVDVKRDVASLGWPTSAISQAPIEQVGDAC